VSTDCEGFPKGEDTYSRNHHSLLFLGDGLSSHTRVGHTLSRGYCKGLKRDAGWEEGSCEGRLAHHEGR